MPIGIFASTIFLSAFLLFWLQPLFSKMVLPLLGGSPSVWNTAMMFFQVTLLAGYGYAHLLTRHIVNPRSQLLLHGAVVAVGLLFLPFAAGRTLPPPGGSPIFWLVGVLAVSVGWPFFALSASAPLLQTWFGQSGQRRSGDPYFLYAASNCGSLLALLLFPVWLEPSMTLARQAGAWALSYGGFCLLLIATGIVLSRAPRGPPVYSAAAKTVSDWRQRLIWIALAFIPSSLLLGVTTYITTDIAAAPLFWVVPLALYLLSFVVAFSRPARIAHNWILNAQVAGILIVSTLVLLVLVFGLGGSVTLVAGAHLLTFFVTAVICHTELARRRPNVDGLTSFYFCLSIGGAAGGIFNALVAPAIFSSDYEYYLALAGACALRAFVGGEPETLNRRDIFYPMGLGLAVAMLAYHFVDARPLDVIGCLAFLLVCAVALYGFSRRPFRFAFGVAAVIGAAALVQGAVGVVHTERNFFGINTVKRIDKDRKVALIHGTTMHGTEFVAAGLRKEPLAYYARSGPVGQMRGLAGPAPSVAVIGLGTGALACYRKAGEDWTFFEIDGAVARIARDKRYFHYLEDCGSDMRIVLGDGRLALKAEPDRRYDLIIVDAFSSDSIPMHLLTKEAVALYLRKLKPHGVILFHVSNEYLNLAPVLTAVIQSLGAAGRHQLFFPSATEITQGASGSEWMLIAATDADLEFLASEKRWQALASSRSAEPWTDDFSNIFRAIRW